MRYSVGVVGLPEHLDEARALRAALRPDVYLWVNAAEGHTYDARRGRTGPRSTRTSATACARTRRGGHECRTGESVLSVLGDGTVRRCHFVPTRLGNLYDGSYLAALRPRPCENAFCDCHIGYVHLKRLPLHESSPAGCWSASRPGPPGARKGPYQPLLTPPLLRSGASGSSPPR